MKAILINTLYNTLRWYVSTGIFDRLAGLVRQLTRAEIPGRDKRAQVIEFAEQEFGLIWGEASSIVIDAIIAVTRLKDAKPT
ncbi:MAG: hypothetical protein VBE63_15340 [Lamprobacter sp.]|uniref:hypothetical protein n=1 Tax=Lamprobacter sp. TaxID=3100796 RepID=UPI002B259C2F|nr:hypothetical protein [Lamprobacter sp.]MEA3641298.1 hypothetical protein [Lamprobacter sp.]